MLRLQMGDREFLIYPKQANAPAGHTMLNFAVDDISGAVAELAAKGISMERYDGVDENGGSRRSSP